MEEEADGVHALFSLSVSGQFCEGKSLLSIPTSVQDSLGEKNLIDVGHIKAVSLIFPNYEVRRTA